MKSIFKVNGITLDIFSKLFKRNFVIQNKICRIRQFVNILNRK